MHSPRILGRRDSLGDGIIQKVGILAQSPPESKALPRVVALVDEMALGRVRAVALLQGQGGALPGLGLEAAVLAQAELDALAEAAEEGGLVGGGPAEARGSSVAVDAGGRQAIGTEHVVVVFGHDVESV